MSVNKQCDRNLGKILRCVYLHWTCRGALPTHLEVWTDAEATREPNGTTSLSESELKRAAY
jgi:hypothetical protein